MMKTINEVHPPHSRLFVLCQKTITQDELRESFGKFGNIEDIWIVKDKTTGESKGVVYIKYSKTSEAALAVEEMNGKTISSGKPLKVMIAHSRDQGSKKDDDMERLLRLFIVVPKTATEDEVREEFRTYGEIDYVNVVKHRETGENKGFAYVKYVRPYDAALAFEECPKSYRAVFAKPRGELHKTNPYQSEPAEPPRFPGGPASSGYGAQSFYMNDKQRWDSNNCPGFGDSGSCKLVAQVHSSLREHHIFRLFDIIPGLEFCRPLHDSMSYGVSSFQKIMIKYSTPQQASHALEKINGFEYPLGQRISVKADQSPDMPPVKESPLLGSAPTSNNTATISLNELQTLTTALSKAESIIKAAGLTPGGFGTPEPEKYDRNYCTAKLPPPAPVLPSAEPAERLFIVCQPGLPPMYALKDVFSRFGNLIELYVLNGKNCGYASYATKESADQAIETLHLQELCGMRLKVMKADPPKSSGHERKRQRMDESEEMLS